MLKKFKTSGVKGAFLTEWTSIADMHCFDLVLASVDFKARSDVPAIHFRVSFDELHLRFDILRFDVDHCDGDLKWEVNSNDFKKVGISVD